VWKRFFIALVTISFVLIIVDVTKTHWFQGFIRKSPEQHMNDLHELIYRIVPGAVGEASPPAKGTVFKWQDKDGVWHYTTTPPPEARDLREVEIRHQTDTTTTTGTED